MQARLPVRTVLALALLPLAPVRADPLPPSAPPSSGRGVIVSFGMGPGSPDLAGLATIQLRRGHWLFGARVASTGEPWGPPHSDTDFGLLVGHYGRGKAGYVSASAGVALVRSVRSGRLLGSNCDPGSTPTSYYGVGIVDCMFASKEYEKLTRQTLGLPIEVRGVLSGKHAGLGVSVFGDLNPRASFFGVALTFELGSLR